MLSHTGLLRAVQLCSSCVQVVKVVMSMSMYTTATDPQIRKSLPPSLGTSVSNTFKMCGQLPLKLAGAY